MANTGHSRGGTSKKSSDFGKYIVDGVFSFELYALSIPDGKALPGGFFNLTVWAYWHNLSEDTILRWIKENNMRVLKLGIEIYIRKEAFEQLEAPFGRTDGKKEVEEG